MKKDVLIYFIGKSTPAIANLVIIILGVRFLGTEQYGKYSLILSGVILITNFSFTWIQQSMVRFLSAFKDHPSDSISRFFFLTIVSTLPGTIALILSCLFYYKLNLFEVFFVVLYSWTLIFFLFRQTVYQTLIRPVKYAIYEGVYNLLLFLIFIGFVFIIAWKNYLILFISMGVSVIIAEVVHQIFFIEKSFRIDFFKIQWNKDFTKKAMDYGFTLTIWIFLFTVTTIADRYILKEFRDYSTLGTYSAIKDLVTKISTFAILPIYLAFNARINDTWNSGNESGALRLVKKALQLELL
ncbi:MAG: oligosaccharide flippase family protein, partial [Bacteroidota bacterium]